LLGLAELGALLARDHRAAAPMLPLSIFRERQFTAASAVTFIVYAALTGDLPASACAPGRVGLSSLASGLAFAPPTVIMLALAARSGPFIAGAGLAMLTFSTSGSSYVAYVLPAVVIFGRARNHSRAAHGGRDEFRAAQHASIASAVNNDPARFGCLLAVAVLPPPAAITGTAYLHPDALAAGFRTAVLISGGLCAAGGLPCPPRSRSPILPDARAQLGSQRLGEYPHCGLDASPLTTSVSQTPVPADS
jgi:hypothetical protein